MSIWTVAEIGLWLAVAAPWVLATLGLLALALIIRRVWLVLAAAAHRVHALLQGSPAADTAIGDDIPDGYDDPDGLAEMRRLAHLVDNPPQVDTTPGLCNDTWHDLEALYRMPAKGRTEENQ